MITELILIRHGSTKWNLKKRYCGYADVTLSEEGRIQAKKLRKRFHKEKIHRVYCSDRKRAIETAKIIFKKLEIEKIPELKEMHFGIFEGKTHQQIMKKHKEIYRKWLNNPYSVTIPKGEDLRNFKKRIVNALKMIISLNQNKTVAVVCHGGTISIFITHLLKTENFWKKIPGSASISIIEYKNGKPAIKLFNDTTHLGRDNPACRK